MFCTSEGTANHSHKLWQYCSCQPVWPCEELLSHSRMTAVRCRYSVRTMLLLMMTRDEYDEGVHGRSDMIPWQANSTVTVALCNTRGRQDSVTITCSFYRRCLFRYSLSHFLTGMTKDVFGGVIVLSLHLQPLLLAQLPEQPMVPVCQQCTASKEHPGQVSTF